MKAPQKSGCTGKLLQDESQQKTPKEMKTTWGLCTTDYKLMPADKETENYVS